MFLYFFRSQFGCFHFSVFRLDNVVLVNFGGKKLFWLNLAKKSGFGHFWPKPQPPIPLHNMGQKRCCRSLGWVSLNCTVPVHTMGQKICVCIPRVGWRRCKHHQQRSVQFQQQHPRYRKKTLLGLGVQWYGCLGRHPRTETVFLDLCSSSITILSIQKDLCGPVGYSGMGGWGATPEPKQYFWELCSSNSIIRGTQKHLC